MFELLVGDVSRWIWQGILLPCIVICGFWFTLQTRGLQIFGWRSILKETVGSLTARKKREAGSVTPFQALCTALAGTVGTGSVVGTCQALALGGPGAVFWMLVCALFGMIIKFYEVTLALLYRKKNLRGEWVGGPMYYLLYGLKGGGKPLALLFSLFGILASFGMGDLAQASGVADGISQSVNAFFSLSENGNMGLRWGIALILGILLATVLFGGVKRLGAFCQTLIPGMSLLFVALSLGVIVAHRGEVSSVVSCIISDAFSLRSVAGGTAGMGMKLALEWGLKRSAFSNEAGLGSAAIAHACAQNEHPVCQGFFGIFEVFVDTFVICSLTAITVLVALPLREVRAHTVPNATLITRAFATLYGSKMASVFIGLSLALFAFSTLLGWSLYGVRCATFLFGSRAEKRYLAAFVLLASVGAIIPMEPIWALSDLFNALMAIPNFIALFALADKVKSSFQEYQTSHFKRKNN